MNMKIYFFVVSMCCVLTSIAGAPAPSSALIFNGDAKQSMIVGPPVKMETSSWGKISYNGIRRLVRQDITKIQIDMNVNMDGFPDMPDLPGGGGGLPGHSINIEVQGTTLLRYDLGKNFTWITLPDGTVSCECSKPKYPFETFMLTMDPTATLVGSADITQPSGPNGENVTSTLTKYKSGLPFWKAEFYIQDTPAADEEGRKFIRRVNISSDGNSMGLSDISMHFDFWNLKSGVAEHMWDPHPTCTCPEPPQIETVDFPSTKECTNAPNKCMCLTSAVEQTMPFCGNTVKWPVFSAIDAKHIDEFAKDIYEAFSENMSGECKTKYKEWVCQFHFNICYDNGLLVMPKAFGLHQCHADAILSNPKFSVYSEAENLKNGHNAQGGEPPAQGGKSGDEDGGMPGWVLAVVVVAIVLVLVGAGIAFFLRRRAQAKYNLNVNLMLNPGQSV